MKLLLSALLLSTSLFLYAQPGTIYLDTVAELNDDYRRIDVIALYDNTTLVSSVYKRANKFSRNVDIMLNGDTIYHSVNGVPLDANQFDTTLVVDSGDVYKVKCWGGGEAVAEITLSVDLTTSVGTLSPNAFRLFPNPVSSVMHIELQGQNQYEIQLVNMQGQVVKNIEAKESFDWDVGNIDTGTYIVNICHRGECVEERIVKVE